MGDASPAPNVVSDVGGDVAVTKAAGLQGKGNEFFCVFGVHGMGLDGLEGESGETRAETTAKDFTACVAPSCEAVGLRCCIIVTANPDGRGVGCNEADECAGFGLVDGGLFHGGSGLKVPRLRAVLFCDGVCLAFALDGVDRAVHRADLWRDADGWLFAGGVMCV